MTNETEKKQKSVKAPGSFKKPIKKNKLDKKYAKYIEHPQDKQFLYSCFELKEDFYIIRGNLTKDDVKKLKGLLKVVKENKKSPVKIIPIIFAASITAAVIIFFTIFANPLLERAMELGLEAAFEARSNVDNLRLSLVPLRIAIGGVTVANRDKPMTNLFQLGKTEINIKTNAILRGKVYISKIEASTIRFGTERKVSGSLPGKPPREKKEKVEKEKSDEPPLVDLKNFDAMALLNQEFDKLNTPKLYDEAISFYDETSTKYKAQVESSTAKVNELRSVTDPLLKINVNNMRDVQTIKDTIEKITTAVNSVQSAANDITTVANGIESDVNKARRMEADARNAITSDINHLKSYIDPNSGEAFAAVEPFIREALSDAANQYLDYGIMALKVLDELKAQSAAKQPAKKKEKPKKEPKVVFKGRDVIFPTVTYPAFYLGQLKSDFTIDTWNWAFDLQNISSDPDLTYRLEKKPAITLYFGAKEETGNMRNVTFDGKADIRTESQERFNALVAGKGFPVSLGDQLKGLGVGGLKGTSEFNVKMTGQPDGGFSSGGDIKINQAALVNPSGTIAEAIDVAIRQAGNINFGMQYIHKVNQTDVFKITSNIAELFAKALRSIAEAYVKKAMDELEKALRQKIDQYIDGRFVSKEDVDTLVKIVKGDKSAVDQMKNSLNAKKDEFEKKLKDLAKDTATQAVKDNLPAANAPKLPANTPKLPGLR
jgi:uncharacterized protein (TIGR03545 family)